MGNGRFNTKTLAFVVALVLASAVASRLFRRSFADHDVSDPGVTL